MTFAQGGVMYVLAQDTAALAGASGWVGTGLLGAVLSWLLLKYLPDKDRQIAELLKVNRDEIKEARAEYTSLLVVEREARAMERRQCHDDHMKMAELLAQNTHETAKLAQENRAVTGAVSNFLNKTGQP